MIILGIETSCDETAASICKDGTILSSIVSNQLIHSKFGGVVPEIASREHEILLNSVVHEALNQANTNLLEIDAIAVTSGPGLAGALLTGVSFAKGFALGLNIPVVPVNHLEGHIFINFLASENLKFPFVCLLVSGGHTQIWSVKGMNNYALLGATRDDAAGEAFDKGARILGLSYPGGPEIEKYATKGDSKKINFPRSLISRDSLEFSFSGLKTSLLYFIRDLDKKSDISIHDICASYQEAIIDTLIEKLKRAMEATKINTCIISGGVASNKSLREKANTVLIGKEIVFPEISYCTDNAAMISYLGELKFKADMYGSINFSVNPNQKLV